MTSIAPNYGVTSLYNTSNPKTGHIRERTPGSFELRYSLGANPATGKRRIATVTVRGTRKEAERELRRLLRALDTGDHVDPNRLTVRE